MFIKSKERFSKKGFIPNWVKSEHQARYQFTKQFLHNKTVVDCACGDGIGSSIFAQNGAKEVLAFDISKETIEDNQKKYKLNNLLFKQSDALSLPIKNEFVDVFVSLETIEHIKEDKAFLKEVSRVLKKDGLFVCSTPNRFITNPGKNLNNKPWNKFHVREYDYKEFKNLLEYFFEEVVIYGQNPKSFKIARFKQTLSKILSLHILVLINQFLKLPQFIFDNIEKHSVKKVKKGKEYEYMIAICKKPL